ENRIIKRLGNQFDKPDLIADAERHVLVFYRTGGQSGAEQKRRDIDAVTSRACVGNTREKTATAPQCADLFQGGLWHRSTISSHGSATERIPSSSALSCGARGNVIACHIAPARSSAFALRSLNFAVRARLVDDTREMLRQHLECL